MVCCVFVEFEGVGVYNFGFVYVGGLCFVYVGVGEFGEFVLWYDEVVLLE